MTKHKHTHKHHAHKDILGENVSPDILWEITKKYNSFQVKRPSGGGSLFTRDPFSLTNKQTRKHSGFISEKAISISHHPDGGVSLSTKKADKHHQPAEHHHSTAFGPNKSGRKTYANVVGSTTKRGYRTDLHKHAIARTSAIKKSQGVQKDSPKPKLRGAKAKKAAEAS